MSSAEDALMFDALHGADGPTPALGERVSGAIVDARFQAVVEQAEAAVNGFFSIKLGRGAERIRALDGLLQALREAKAETNPALFTVHFGALLMDAAGEGDRVERVFRAERDLTHASLWFPTPRVELFPFHKAFKAITRGPDESLLELFELSRQLAALG